MPKDTYTRNDILAAIALEPCHITGLHNPTHTPFGVCEFQRADQLKRLLIFLEVREDYLPRQLHQQCGWCGTSDRWSSKEVPVLHEWQSLGQAVSEADVTPCAGCTCIGRGDKECDHDLLRCSHYQSRTMKLP